MKSSLKVAVVGGGIGGITASIALRNAGFATCVYESRTDFAELGVAVILTPNGLNALAGLGGGIVDRVLADGLAVPVNGVVKLFAPDGTAVNDTGRPPMDLVRRFGRPQVTIRRNVLHRILLDAHGQAGLHGASHLVGLDNFSDGVVARFRDGSAERADLLVGADGLHSAVRGVLHGQSAPRYTGWSNLRGVSSGVVLPAAHSHGLAILDGRDHVMSCPVGRDGSLYWSSAFEIASGEWPRDPRQAWEEVLSRISGWHVVEDIVKAADPTTLVPREIRDRPPLESWSAGRVTLLGDAAHPMSNFWGQGANSAIEDGVVLARYLSDTDGDIPTALAAYDGERVPRTTELVRGSASVEGHLGDHEAFLHWIYSYDAAAGGSRQHLPTR